MAKKKDKKDLMECGYCGEQFDMSDLGEVSLHGFGGCLEGKEPHEIEYSASQQLGDPFIKVNPKAINSN
jgi:hypothetical protein